MYLKRSCPPIDTTAIRVPLKAGVHVSMRGHISRSAYTLKILVTNAKCFLLFYRIKFMEGRNYRGFGQVCHSSQAQNTWTSLSFQWGTKYLDKLSFQSGTEYLNSHIQSWDLSPPPPGNRSCYSCHQLRVYDKHD